MLRKSFQKQYFLVDGNKVQPKQKKMEEIPDCCIKCTGCGEIFLEEEIKKNLMVCKKCNTHMPIASDQRLENLFDDGQYQEMFADIRTKNPLDFPEYEEKIAAYQDKSGLREAVIIAKGKMDGFQTVLGVMDSRFMMGSMGSVVGEKITRAAELALSERLPLILFTASGGARMQEGIISLMQMAKTSAALGRLETEKIPFFVVLTHPTTGGVTASFAMLGDVILAEPNALIGFAGPRVIEQTIKQKLPEGFQSAEFQLEKGFVDAIVNRSDMKKTLGTLLRMHGGEANEHIG
ncbi:acetyl-CoA carboxylase carboxyltransferase subunit beta [Clostridia bacterium]|nr:acetyl-CoA carboxylase carboxyltransferase subunit beta [Clostridia bacterium]